MLMGGEESVIEADGGQEVTDLCSAPSLCVLGGISWRLGV